MDSMSFSGKQDILCVARSIEMSTVCVIMLIHVEECSIFYTTQRLTKKLNDKSFIISMGCISCSIIMWRFRLHAFYVMVI